MLIRKSISAIVACAFFLSSCVTNGAGGSTGFNVGPALSSSVFKSKVDEEPGVQKPKLDIIVPVFDPGLPTDPAKYKEAGIWPELRRAEATRFAHKMKLAIEDTEAFGAVRVMPDKTATGDVYVLGRINQSNGENVNIALEVFDISGKLWFSKSFDHDVPEDFYTNIRNEGQDPYTPVFKAAADRLVEELSYISAKDLAQVQALTDLRFGANFSEEAFAQYMDINGSRVSLIGYPAEGDQMLKRVKAIRVRDQLFTDRMQDHYVQFSQKMEDSYAIWQEQSALEIKAERQAKLDSAGQAAAGVALIGLAVLAAVAGSKSDNSVGQSAGVAGAVIGGLAGASYLSKSFQTSDEAKFHREALAELGQSIDIEIAPQVVEFEKSTQELTGTAQEQFAQWRGFLKKVYAQEATPDVQL